MTLHVGVLTAGGDSPGLNAALRALGKAALGRQMEVIGFLDGFRGLMENRTVRLDRSSLSGILSRGGTVLGTSRDKPHRMQVGGRTLDMTGAIRENYERHQLDVLICIGGGGTQKNAHRLAQAGLKIVTLPKTIDNDVWGTDTSFGFDTALGIATEAVDRLHSTAHSHHRIIVVEIMGHRAGWLALGAGVAGGADVVLIPELPYEISRVADAIRRRSGTGKNFSIVAVAEGAMCTEEAREGAALEAAKAQQTDKVKRKKASERLKAFHKRHKGNTLRLTDQLEAATGLESRVTILGHVQRGGTPSAQDRLLATRLGTEAIRRIAAGEYGVMIAAKGESAVAIPLADVVGRRKVVPADHHWVMAARAVGTCLG